MIDSFATLHVPFEKLVDKLTASLGTNSDPEFQRALLLALGNYSELHRSLPARDLKRFLESPDPGVHAAADWLLRNHLGTELPVPVSEPNLNRAIGWCRDQWANSMVVVSGPVDFSMGSPLDERDRGRDERQHERRIPRSFAVAMREVTFAEFIDHLPRNQTVDNLFKALPPSLRGDQQPVVAVSWFDAAKFCNELSALAGLEECYQVIEGSTKDNPISIVPFFDYLSRTGYRLPTEAEWEFVCRADTATCTPFGGSVGLLARYGWYEANAMKRTHDVGLKLPNQYGCFDMLGNAGEWCTNEAGAYPLRADGVDDVFPHPSTVTSCSFVRFRGGSYIRGAGVLRSAQRFNTRADVKDDYIGFRVARTIPQPEE